MRTVFAPFLSFVLFSLSPSTPSPAPAAPQAPGDPVAAGYHLLWSGDQTAAIRHFEALARARPTDAPAQFGLLVAQSEQMDVEPALQPAFERGIDALIAQIDARYRRSKQDAEALFYLAQAHLLRAEYRFDHDKGMWGAARDGAKAKGYVDTYLTQHPEHGDAYLVVGAYNYYVDLAPTFFKTLRFLLFLPPGNRVEGLKQLERAAAQGSYFGPKAQTILLDVYSAFEGRTADAVATAERLKKQFPASDPVDAAIGELYASEALEDYARAAAAYQAIVDRRSVDGTLSGSTARYRALEGLSSARLSQWRLEDAIAALAPPIDGGVTNPDWVMPNFLLRRGNYRALLDDPAAADDARRVLADSKMARWHAGATEQLKWIEQRRASGEGVIYAALVPGNRLVSEGRFDDARKAYDAAAGAQPEHALVRFRRAHLDVARGEAERAIPAFTALAANKTAPIAIRAASLLWVARAHDLAGRRDAARKIYQQVVDDYDKQRAAGAAKLGLITPYKRPLKT